MESFAQNFEDVTLRRTLCDVENNFYVDIGAYHPRIHSGTKHFYDRGWSGINVDPNPALLENFLSDRQRDINLGLAVGSSDSEIGLHVIGNTGLTTTLASVASGHASTGRATAKVLRVNLIRLETLFETYCDSRTIDFLKIDVECAESDVILPYQFENRRPRIIAIENADGYHDHLLSRGYILCWFDGLNRWYVREEDEKRCDLLPSNPPWAPDFGTRFDTSLT